MNGTFNSLMNPVKKIAALIREKYLDLLILVDAVSCMADDKIEFNA